MRWVRVLYLILTGKVLLAGHSELLFSSLIFFLRSLTVLLFPFWTGVSKPPKETKGKLFPEFFCKVSLKQCSAHVKSSGTLWLWIPRDMFPI